MTSEPLNYEQAAEQEVQAALTAWTTTCQHCAVQARTRVVGLGRHIVEEIHEPGCPVND